MIKPAIVCRTIYDIDYNKVYEMGKRIILCDLDNTIISYSEKKPSAAFVMLLKRLKEKGFKFYVISNNHLPRVKNFCESLPVDGFLHKANKPLKNKIAKYLKQQNIDPSIVLAIGDQIVTDLYSFGGLKMSVALVKSIDRGNEKWYTKLNRLREKRYLRKLLKEDDKLYRQIKEIFGY